jgi:hypothetical protein
MSAIVSHFSQQGQQPPMETPSSILSARVSVGFNFAVTRVCQNVGHIAHADEKAENVVWLAIHDVLVRAASDPDVTLAQLLLAFYELAPEDAARKTNGAR